MMHKRTVHSLLLISFMLVLASVAMAQTVTFETSNAARCAVSIIDVRVSTPSDVSAIEIVAEVTTTTGGAFWDNVTVAWAPGLTQLTNRVVDLSGVDYVSPDTIRLAAMRIATGDVCLPNGQNLLVAQLNVTPENVCSGTFKIDAGTVTCPNFPTGVSTQFVDCATTSLVPASVTPGVITIVNTPPVITAVNDTSLPWGSAYSKTLIVTGGGACNDLTFTKVTGPASLTVSPTGQISWTTTGADVCDNLVEIRVSDGCGAFDLEAFTICVTNQAPELTCPNMVDDDLLFDVGTIVEVPLSGSDPDGGPGALQYSLVSFDGPGTATVNPATGLFTWPTVASAEYMGFWTATVAVTDGADACDPCSPRSADTCSFTLAISPFMVVIEKTHGAYQGQEEIVNVDLYGDDPDGVFLDQGFGGYDLLIQYDASALTFTYAEPGTFLDSCGWEYFTYRFGASGNCGGNACPSGTLRITAIAETNNGPNHPDCFNQEGRKNLAQLHFQVTNDRTFNCQYVPVTFIWYDCGDNALSSQDGNWLLISRRVFTYIAPPEVDAPMEYEYLVELTDTAATWPTGGGAQPECWVQPDTSKPRPLRIVDFRNGGVDIICADSIDASGDINLNNIAYEIADAVLYSNYFVYGLGVFDNDPDRRQGQIAASDVNLDGLTLSVADLVYLIRVVIGDATPYPKLVTEVNADYIHTKDGVLGVKGELAVGAAFAVVAGNVTPQLLADDMDLSYAFDGVNTRILVYSLDGHAFSGDFLQAKGELLSLEMADILGNPILAKWVPDEFSLSQNYPNPFNPTTTISFTVPVATQYSLTIYNVNGQKVTTFNGAAEPGLVELEWDAASVASGVYFYRLSAGAFSDTKKMVLLK